MRLLFDQNLSPRLKDVLADLYPASVHVRDVGLQSASDEAVWECAVQHQLTIVSKDADLHQRSFLFGYPPKVVWVAHGNCSTTQVEAVLRAYYNELLTFERDEEASFLRLA